MNTYFEEEILILKSYIKKMFNLTDIQINVAFTGLLTGEISSIETVKLSENEIDDLDLKVDKLCQKLFALTAPVSRDLRVIMSSMKIGNELERVGDMAYEISKRTNNSLKINDVIKHFNFKDLLLKIESVLRQTNESYINYNAELANSLIAKCRKTELICKNLFNEIVNFIVDKSNTIIFATDLILITRNLERIVSHLENIAELVVFIVDGKILKHPKLQQSKQNFDED